MTHFPVISSILSPKHIAEYAINEYGLDTKTKCSILKTGINHSYLISSSSNKFVLRVYFINWRTKNEIEEELKLLNCLRQNGVSVSYPIKNTNGDYIKTISSPEGNRFTVLFSYAEGKSIRNPSEIYCYKLGLEMAKMHQLTENKKINRKIYNADTLVNWAFTNAKKHFTDSTNEIKYFKQANNIISTKFSNADSNALRHGVIHLDLWYENMKIKDESQITFFDFDNCGNGWLFLDISYSLMLIFRNEPDKELFKKKRESFYRGYESITSISKEEKKLIPYGGLAIWLHYTGIHVERFNDFSNHFISDEFLKYWIHTLDLWMKFNKIEINTTS